MRKIKITHNQYKNILISEQRSRLINNSNSEQVLEEGLKDVLLGVSLLMGVNLTGLNKTNAQKAVADSTIMSEIKSTLENEEKIKELSKAFSEKGMQNPDMKLSKNAQKIVDRFNELAETNAIKDRINKQVVYNLMNLNGDLKKDKEN